MTHTVTHTTKRVDGSNGTDGADVRNTPDRKAPKALKTARRSTPIHFVISRSLIVAKGSDKEVHKKVNKLV